MGQQFVGPDITGDLKPEPEEDESEEEPQLALAAGPSQLEDDDW